MTRPEFSAFSKIGETNRSMERYIRDLAGLAAALQDGTANATPSALLGIRHAIDECKILMALRAARDEVDLEMKAAILVGFPPMIAENGNLVPMIDAALVADVQRIKPARLPIELRHKFRQ